MDEVNKLPVNGKGRSSSKESLSEILQVAILYERTAHSFYCDLAPKVSENLRGLLDVLIKEEEEHVNLFTSLLSHPGIKDYLSLMVNIPESNERFADAFSVQDLGDSPDEKRVLRYAITREQISMEQYSTLAKEFGSGAIRDVFLYMSQQEREHKQELERLYNRAVQSGDNQALCFDQLAPVTN